MQTVTIIGVGRLGGALAIALERAGYLIETLVVNSRPIDPIVLGELKSRPKVVSLDDTGQFRSRYLFIATSDSAISVTAQTIADRLTPETTVFHCSGALTSEVLSLVAERGSATGSIHPLVSIGDAVRGSKTFEGAYFCVEGSPLAVDSADSIVKSLGGIPFSLDNSFRPLYHASAVMAAGHVAALFASSVKTLDACGIGEDEAVKMLLPLIRSTIENVSVQGLSDALTGPFVRGDRVTIEEHLAAFDRTGLQVEKEIYLALGARSLKLASSGRATESDTREIAEIIKLAMASCRW